MFGIELPAMLGLFKNELTRPAGLCIYWDRYRLSPFSGRACYLSMLHQLCYHVWSLRHQTLFNTAFWFDKVTRVMTPLTSLRDVELLYVSAVTRFIDWFLFTVIVCATWPIVPGWIDVTAYFPLATRLVGDSVNAIKLQSKKLEHRTYKQSGTCQHRN